jgi:hypothetical protein
MLNRDKPFQLRHLDQPTPANQAAAGKCLNELNQPQPSQPQTHKLNNCKRFKLPNVEMVYYAIMKLII